MPPRPTGSWPPHVLLRLPLEVRDLFREWLAANFPNASAMSSRCT
jgi:hypothetical protein